MTEYQVICNLHESLFNALTNGLQDAEDNAEKEKMYSHPGKWKDAVENGWMERLFVVAYP